MPASLPLEDSPFKLDEHGPVFLLGCPRSGTTFLSGCVRAIRGVEEFVGILCPPRLCHALATEDRPDREALLFASVRDTFWGAFWHRRYSLRHRVAEAWCGFLPVRDLFRTPTLAGSLFCYKEPFLCFAADKFARHFRAAKFIHIVRDGRDNADSLERAYPDALSSRVLQSEALSLNKNSEIGVWTALEGVNVPWWVPPEDRQSFVAMSRYERCVLMWREMTCRARGLRTLGPDRYLELRYEDLVGDPMHWGRTLTAFLGRDFDRRVRKAFGLATVGSVRVSERNQRENTRENATDIAGPILRELGYEV